jgi:hypothetical protein
MATMEDPLRCLQEAVDLLMGREDVPDNVFLEACAALKQLHSLTNLYKVTFVEFYTEASTEEVFQRTRTQIMPSAQGRAHSSWWSAFDERLLPRDLSEMQRRTEPFSMNGNQIIVLSVESYLKRPREDDESDS